MPIPAKDIAASSAESLIVRFTNMVRTAAKPGNAKSGTATTMTASVLMGLGMCQVSHKMRLLNGP